MPRILAAKVPPPSLPTTYVPRPLLEGRLDGALNRRLTVLMAGAGFGKSTLLAAWTARHRSETQVVVVGGGATGAAVLRDLAPHCIEGTGGLFVLLPEHDQSYGDAFMEGCRKTGVPYEELTVAEARRREPLLTPRLSRVSAVPDGTFVGKYDIAMDVGRRCGSRRRRAGPIFITCDSETCCWHIAKATGLPVYHPVQVLDRAYRSRPPPSGQECADDHCD